MLALYTKLKCSLIYDVFVLFISDQTDDESNVGTVYQTEMQFVFYMMYSYCYCQTRLVQEPNVDTVYQTEMQSYI